MATIAELKIIVDTAQVDGAVDSLNKLTESAGKVQGSADSMSQGINKAAESSENMTNAGDRIIAKAKQMVETFGFSKGEVLAYKGTLAGVGDVVKPLTTSFDALTTAKKAEDAINKEMARSQSRSDAEKYKMLESLREEIALYGKSKEQITLYRAEQMGIIDAVKPLIDQLNYLKDAKESSGDAGLDATNRTIAAKQQELVALKAEGEEIKNNAAFLAEEGAIRGQLAEHQARLAKIQKEAADKSEEIASLQAVQEGHKAINKERKRSEELAKKEQDAFLKLRNEIDPTKASFEKYYEQLEKIEKLREKTLSGKGNFDIEELNEMKAAVDLNIDRLGVLSGTTGKTAKEINFAMRGLPAQFTDIATSIASGQKPMTVFLQQGGQIKDMFGGVGIALKHMASYVWGLVTPFTVVAAIIAAVGIAALQGDRQVSKLNRAMIQSGSSAVISSAELRQYSDSAAGVYGTVGKAMEVVGQIISDTKIHKDSIETVTRATLAWSKATGEATSDVLSDFDKLSRDPVAALQELNDKYKFLTISMYENVKALADSGDAMGATELAVGALAQATEDKARLMVASLGKVGSVIQWIKDVALGAVDAVASIGRPDPAQLENVLQAKHDNLALDIKRLEERQDKGNRLSLLRIKKKKDELEQLGLDLEAAKRAAQTSADAPYIEGLTAVKDGYKTVRSEVERAEEALKEYLGSTKLAVDADKLSSQAMVEREAKIKSLERAIHDAKEAESGDKDVRMARERLTMAEEQFAVTERVGAQQKELSRQRIEFQRLEDLDKEGLLTHLEKAKLSRKEEVLLLLEQSAELEKQHIAQKAASRSTVERASAADRLLQTLVGQHEVLREQLASDRRLGKEANLLNKLKSDFLVYEQRMRDGTITKEQRSLLLSKEAILAQQRLNVELEREQEIRVQDTKLSALRLNLNKALEAERQKARDLVSSIGSSDKEVERLRERNGLERERIQALQDAQQLFVETGDEYYYKNQIEELENFYDQKKQLLEDYYQTEEELYDKWQEGLAAGMENFLENNRNIYQTIKESTESILTDLNTGIRDSLVQSLLYGENLRESFQNLAATITERVLGSLIDVGIQYLINSGMKSLASKTETATEVAGITAVAGAGAIATTAAVTSATLAGAAITAAYTPAAIAAAIATSGGAAVAATTAIGIQTPIMAASIASSSLAGFKDGGYTGNVGVNDVAGVVHGKEFVFDAESTSRIGVDNLEKMRSGGQSSGGGDININTQISVNAEAGMSDRDARSQGEAAAQGFEARVVGIMAKHKRAGGMLSTV